MIHMSVDVMRLSPAVARALAAFMGEDEERRSLMGLGIDGGDVCATDGHTSVRFKGAECEPGFDVRTVQGLVIGREVVEREIKASGPRKPVVLRWAERTGYVFPKLSQVEPVEGVWSFESHMIDARFLARLELVAKACRKPKDEAGEYSVPGVVLNRLGAAKTTPLGFSVGGPWAQHATAHEALVLIMPMDHEIRRYSSLAPEGTVATKKPRGKRAVKSEAA